MKMHKKQYKLTDELSLSLFPVEQEVEQQNESVHHIWILDRSGSMYRTLPAVIEDLKKQARTLEDGDALSFGYFSSKGQYGFPVKVFRINGEQSFEELDKLFDMHSETMSMTCFSDVLQEASKVIDETSFLNFKTSMMFFSDGYCNSNSVSEEYELVRKILPELSPKLNMFLSVSHSNYADKEFLAEMAEMVNGESVSSDSLKAFSRIMLKYIRGVKKLTPAQVVRVDSEPNNIVSMFSFGDDIVNSFSIREDGLVQSPKDVWVIERNQQATDVPSVDVLYASALSLCRKGHVDLAMEVLNVVGDKKIMDKLDLSFTPSERGVAEDLIKDAIFDPKARLLDGKVENYLPDPNKFCLLDFLELLSDDEEVRILPKHKEFEYNPIGRPRKVKEGYQKFNTYVENACPIEGLTWNKEFLNLSMRIKVKGSVYVPDTMTVEKDDEKVTLTRPNTLTGLRESFQWRNFSIVKDGFCNIRQITYPSKPKDIGYLI